MIYKNSGGWWSGVKGDSQTGPYPTRAALRAALRLLREGRLADRKRLLMSRDYFDVDPSKARESAKEIGKETDRLVGLALNGELQPPKGCACHQGGRHTMDLD